MRLPRKLKKRYKKGGLLTLHLETLRKKNKPNEDKMTLVYSESVYDHLEKMYGENCGFDKNKVIVLRGYPKFDL